MQCVNTISLNSLLLYFHYQHLFIIFAHIIYLFTHILLQHERKGVRKKLVMMLNRPFFLALISKYGESNVVFRSKEDEGSHYDIRYTKDKRTKYVEVKNISNGYFEISRDEVLFGRKHWEDYEVWLYRDGKVTPIKDFFNEKGECKFQLDYAKSYIVVLRESC